MGDSITDPNCYGDKIKKYWDFLQEWLGITPYVYGISGRQWNDVPRQAEQLKKEHGEEVDAIVILMGTNDFNDGVPIGEWFTETEEQVMAARGQTQKLETRKKRTPIMDGSTYKGRINIGINRLKQLFPDKQIVFLNVAGSSPVFHPKRSPCKLDTYKDFFFVGRASFRCRN